MSSHSVASSPREHFLISLIGVAVIVYVYFLCVQYGVEPITMTLLMVASYGGSIIAMQAVFLRSPLNPSTGLDFARMQWSFSRTLYKLVGVYGSFAFIALLYWIFPEYHGEFYDNYYAALTLALPVVLILVPPYVALVDACMKQPHDSYYAFGRLLLLRPSGMTWAALLQHLLGWVMRGYFVALLFIYASDSLREFIGTDFSAMEDTVLSFFPFAVTALLLLALIVNASGYIYTLRLFDTHIRSVDPTGLGWMVCLICFQPFRGIADLYLNYPGDDDNWMAVLADMPGLETAWAVLLLLTLACVVLADISLGSRYANLSHRGVVTGGLFRFTKHPAYIAQNLFWMLTILPFHSGEGIEVSARYTLVYTGIAIIYFLRARTEERHLSRDPEYVAYALRMNERGLLRHLGRWIPFFRYRAPVGWEQLPSYEGIK